MKPRNNIPWKYKRKFDLRLTTRWAQNRRHRGPPVDTSKRNSSIIHHTASGSFNARARIKCEIRRIIPFPFPSVYRTITSFNGRDVFPGASTAPTMIAIQRSIIRHVDSSHRVLLSSSLLEKMRRYFNRVI